MIYRNVELHNVEELIEQPDGGVLLQRVPESLRRHLNPGAQERMRGASGCEIRFVSDGTSVDVTLSAQLPENGLPVPVTVFWGDYQYSVKLMVTDKPEKHTIQMHNRLRTADEKFIHEETFSRRVVRIRPGGGYFYFHGIEGENVRPPKPEELPSKRLLMYGTSITQGAAASFPHLSYASVTARKLGMDLINLGSGGSCQCEAVKGDYIAARKDWDVAVLALSVNMRGFDPDEYAKRVSYVVKTAAATGKPVFCITLWPYFGDMTAGGETIEPGAAPSEDFRQKLRDAAAACPGGNVQLLEGPELFTDTSGLTGDLIHPGDFGMMEMGTNLAAAMKKLLP